MGGDLRTGGIVAIAAAAALVILAVWAPLAGATDIHVDILTDESTNNTTCSLREAITSAVTDDNSAEDDCELGSAAESDDVLLDPGTYTLTAALDFTEADGQRIHVDGETDANGVPTTTIDANNAGRIMDLQADGANPMDVFLHNLILTHGKVTSTSTGDGGAVRIQDPDAFFGMENGKILDSDAGHHGGAISWSGADENAEFQIEGVEFSGNTAGVSENTPGGEGGALWLDMNYDGSAHVARSTFTGNSSDEGGAVYLMTRADVQSGPDGIWLKVTNSTFTGNTASEAGGAFGFDAANSATLFINFSTIADNTSTPAGSGGGISTTAGQQDDQFVFIGQSILAGNKAGTAPSNCAGPGNIQSAGYNVSDSSGCGFSTGNNDLLNTDPLLAPLAVNPGGEVTTRTRGLFDGSPALNRIPVANCTAAIPDGDPDPVDQRNVIRPVGTNCDVGAFEGSLGPRPGPPNAKCGGKAATIVGTNGKNTLVGTNKADVIAGLGGNDTIKGKGGKDIICGGKGKDKLIGGKGRDKLFGQAGRDILRGGPGRDKLKGGPGRDKQIQ